MVSRSDWDLGCSLNAIPGQNGCHFTDNIFRCILVNQIFLFWSKFHWNLFSRVQLKTTSIGSDNGAYFNEILFEIWIFSLKEMHLKMLSVKWHPFYPGLNVLTHWGLGPFSLMIFCPQFAVIPLLGIRSQLTFAHATTAQLSCHVQNFVAITFLESGLIVKQNFHRIWIAMEKLLVKQGPGDIYMLQWTGSSMISEKACPQNIGCFVQIQPVEYLHLSLNWNQCKVLNITTCLYIYKISAIKCRLPCFTMSTINIH